VDGCTHFCLKIFYPEAGRNAVANSWKLWEQIFHKCGKAHNFICSRRMKVDRDVDLQQAFLVATQRQSALHLTPALVDGRPAGLHSNAWEGSSGAPRFDRLSHRIERIHCALP
jgi:hypothetical protein